MDSVSYHLSELKAAQRADDPCRVMPEIPKGCKRILDVGCGAGQTLIASDLGVDTLACGVDPDFTALQAGKQLAQQIQFVHARGEDLPFRNDFFDFAISRVALPYMDIPGALAEIQRVLAPGRTFWGALHPFSMAWQDLLQGLRSFNVKIIVFRLYVLLNGLAFHLTGKLFRFPLKRERCESFQTARGIRRALFEAGFTDVEVRRNSHFIVMAKKRS